MKCVEERVHSSRTRREMSSLSHKIRVGILLRLWTPLQTRERSPESLSREKGEKNSPFSYPVGRFDESRLNLFQTPGPPRLGEAPSRASIGDLGSNTLGANVSTVFEASYLRLSQFPLSFRAHMLGRGIISLQGPVRRMRFVTQVIAKDSS